jgi:hypothetical protein
MRAATCCRGPGAPGSNTLDVGFCIKALEEALSHGCPEVFNTDQGVQYTFLNVGKRFVKPNWYSNYFRQVIDVVNIGNHNPKTSAIV